MDFNDQLHAYQQRVEQKLDRLLPPDQTHPQSLHQAMRYAMLGSGKRIRPVLVYATGEAVGLSLDELDAPACAVELIHGYSLVHDDLPAMDDDDLRRGQPTCHKKFDEATAILAGDALQALAFYTLTHNSSNPARTKMVEQLALASGSRGMVGGQAIDLGAVGKQLNLAELEDMHIHKTGALIRTSVLFGALGQSSLTADEVEALDHYGKCIGLAFQIQDDILDVEGDTSTIGKPQGSDTEAGKPTYPSILGLSNAKKHAQQYLEDALASIEFLGAQGRMLKAIAEYIVLRDR